MNIYSLLIPPGQGPEIIFEASLFNGFPCISGSLQQDTTGHISPS